jgi:DNA invertase Pin-like site-specific DNA recombinase
MRVGIYARVSTSNGQQSTDNQLDELRAWAERLGHEVVEVYVDEASGTKGAKERPSLQDALRGAHQRRYDVLLIWALDRLSRGGIGATADLLGRLGRAGVQVKSLRESWLDTTTPGIAELITAIMSWVAQQERARIVERVHAGLARARKHGTQSGRPIGRPRLLLDPQRVRRTVERSGSLRKAAAVLNISVRSIRRCLEATA